MVSWYSLYGTGATIHGVERTDDDRVQFTSWITLFWIPVVPLASWSAIYAGERPPDGLTDESYYFADLRRIPHDGSRIGRTLISGLLMAIIASAPTVAMIELTDGRAATNWEMVLVFAGAFWAFGVIVFAERVRRNKLRPT